MIVTGNQIRAARALLGWKRRDLALHPNAVAYWERREHIPAADTRPPWAAAACRKP